MFFAPQTPVTPDYVTNPQNYATDASGALVLDRFGQPKYKLDTGSGGMSLMQTLAIVTAIVAPEAVPALATELGVSTAAASAIYGGTTNAISTALNGGNLEQIAQAGGSGAAGSIVGSEVGSDIGEATGSTTAGATAGGATKGFTQAELSGKNLNQATQAAELGGATAGITDILAGGDSPSTKALTGTAVGTALNLSNIFGTQPTKSSSQVGAGKTYGGGATGSGGGSTYAGAPGTVTTTGQATGSASPTSTALLGQALSVGDPSAPIQTSEGGKTGPNVWNQASLRTMDSTGGATGGGA